jgi:hypothetical protein
MTRALILALLLVPIVTPAVAAAAKCETARKQAFECHQSCQDSYSDAAGLKRCETKCPSAQQGCADETNEAPAK